MIGIVNYENILLIGDSIGMGYDKFTKMAFEDSAEVYFPKDNCRFTGYIIRHLNDWKNELNLSEDVDLVHWNAGLWDDLVMFDDKHLVSLESSSRISLGLDTLLYKRGNRTYNKLGCKLH